MYVYIDILIIFVDVYIMTHILLVFGCIYVLCIFHIPETLNLKRFYLKNAVTHQQSQTTEFDFTRMWSLVFQNMQSHNCA